MASASEVDERGIVECLATAAKRALSLLHSAGVPVGSATILLDGAHDWLTPRLSTPLTVVTRVKADRDCASVAAASVLAKVQRDLLMIEAATLFPLYGWDGNKGYGSAGHFAAIAVAGATEWHRTTWLHNADAASA
jgi:ribonuclease HII